METSPQQMAAAEAERLVNEMKGKEFNLTAGVGFCKITVQSAHVREIHPRYVVIPPATLIKWAALLLSQPHIHVVEAPAALPGVDLTKPGG